MILKNKHIKYIISSILCVFFVACSTKRDNFATRNWQALNTKYNINFNSNEALEKGVKNLKNQYNDNFWEILPIERQLPVPEKKAGEDQAVTKNPDFDLAEDKAVKAVQKRSIYIDGTERNFQIDESYLLLGKARYYTNRFIPAMEAFNYILYKYPTSSNIHEAKIWREKTNIRLDNDEFAIKNLTTLIAEIKEKNQIYADANAILAQAYIKVEQKDSAAVRLQKALEFTKNNEEKARYRFIIGQLYQDLDDKDKAFANYQAVIDMKRKAPKQYVINAYVRQSGLGLEKDSTLFLKKYNDLLKDRENRPFLDVLHHQIALFYDKNGNIKQAKKQYNLSLRNKKSDTYLEASNYRNLASIYFYQSKYATAGKYYDSTLVKLNQKTKEFALIKKKRENLDDVIKYEEIAARNDSILKIIGMNEADKYLYFEKYIADLKIKEAKEKLAEKEKEKKIVVAENTDNQQPTGSRKGMMPPRSGQNGNQNIPSDFYFYNAQTVAFGKTEFAKTWGERELQDNWKWIEGKSKTNENGMVDNDPNATGKTAESKYSVDYYLRKLPKKQTEIAELEKDRNFSYYQLGVIYKEKFKEYYLAKDKLESLLTKNPEERLILPSMYNLYKIYEIIDANKALAMKDEIIKRFPNSRYAQILSGANANEGGAQSPEIAYKNLFKIYSDGDYRTVLKQLEIAVNQYSGEEIISKMELLKANTIGKIKGLAEFKKALNFVALTYPNTEEDKKTEKFLAKDIVAMEALQFNAAKPTSWKVLYKIGNPENSKDLLDKITKFSNDRSPDKPIFSIDLYTMDENFVVLHGWKNEEQAKGIVTILKEYKDYKVIENAIVISNDNYKIVQIKKNLPDYLADPKKAPKPVAGNQNSNDNNNQNSNSNQNENVPQPQRPGSPRQPQKVEAINTINAEETGGRFAPPEVMEIKDEPKKQ